MSKAAAERGPSPLAPPAPSPMQHGPSVHSSLALTPERPVPTVTRPRLRGHRPRRAPRSASSSPSTEAGLASASPLCAPPRPLPHALSHPSINSTRRLDQQLREMGKENFPPSKTRGEAGAVRLPEEALNKVRGAPALAALTENPTTWVEWSVACMLASPASGRVVPSLTCCLLPLASPLYCCRVTLPAPPLQVVGVPASERVYKDLTSVEVTPSALPHTAHRKVTARRHTADPQEPDVFELYPVT